jgi:ATP-dependent exoDNAse (exonuclease V) beta subunit
MSNILPKRDIDLRSRNGLLFTEDSHTYVNADGEIYTGMSTFIKQFSKEFDEEATAKYKAIKEVLPTSIFNQLKKKVGGWDKMHLYFEKLCIKSASLEKSLMQEKQNILDEWAKSAEEGSIEHDKREKDVIQNGITWNGKHYPYANKTILDITPDDVCVVPEIMVWCHDSLLCGLADLPIFDKGTIHILDYKTNKEITMSGFMGATMNGPFSGVPDCSLGKYSAQLHGYMKMACDITGFNRGECVIIHTASEKYEREEDKYIPCLDLSTNIEEAFKLRL